MTHLSKSFLRPAILAVGIASLLQVASFAAVTYIGEAVIPGNGVDQSGLPATILDDGVSPQNGLNGFGSGFGYAGGNLFYALEDRGPNKVAYSGGTAVDNTVKYPNRYQQFVITATPVPASLSGGLYTSYTIGTTNVATTLLSNAQGQQYLGISTAFSTNPAVENHRLDSEGIRVAPDGTVWISDEYGPYILHFNHLGQEIGSLPLPAGYQPASPGATAAIEASNTTGRTTNRGMEGLAISPDGKTLVGMMQSSLTQDGGLNGVYTRVIVYDLTHQDAPPKQYVYQLDSKATPISDLLAINSHEFLVDERDGVVGAAGIKKLYRFDLNQASAPTDLTNTAFSGTTASNGLPASGPISGVTILQKSLFADIGQILNTANTNSGGTVLPGTNGTAGLPDKIEGYAWGPDLADGRHLLLATNDNDFVVPGGAAGNGFPNYIWAFAVDPSDVPNFQQETFDSDAVSSIDHIVVVYQENWTFDGLYGSFPNANGVTNASTASKTQIDRLTGGALVNLPSNSFNNVALTGTSTLNPPPPLTADSNNSANDPHFSPTPDTLHPWSLTSFIDPTVLTGDIYHRYWQEQFQIAGVVTNPNGTDSAAGNNSGFVTWSDNPGLVMSRFDATNLPEGVLAQQFTICDNFFHSAFGGSFLNHQFLIAAAAPVYNNMPTSNNANIAYLDANGVFVMNTSGAKSGKYAQDGSITPVAGDVVNVTLNGTTAPVTVQAANTEAFAGTPGTTFDKHYVVNTTRSINLPSGTDVAGAVSLLPSQNDSNPTNANGDTRPYIPTIGDALSAANVSWKWYSGSWTQIVGYSTANPTPITSPTYATYNGQYQMQYHHQPFAYFDNYAPFGAGTVPAVYVGGFAGVGTGGLTFGQTNVTQAQNSAAHLQDETNFFTDVQNNTLPSVVFIKPVGINNEHPGYAALQTGQAHVASIVQALQANPTLWAHTMVIVTYDEHGGRWDHVTPPSRDIWGPGERVPAIIISPLAKKGVVDHTQRDTSSVLSTIEQRFNLAPLNGLDAAAPTFFGALSTVDVARSGYTSNRRTNQYTQTVTVTNRGYQAITGPINVVLDNLSSNTSLANATGTTANNAPLNAPYITVPNSSSLAAGASVTVTLQFAAPTTGSISYSPRTVVGTATP